MKDKAKIDDKSYRSLVKINDPTRISVKTSVGESKKATMPTTTTITTAKSTKNSNPIVKPR